MSCSTNPFGQSSSSPFGSSHSAFGQPNNSSNNPFASKPFGSPTPLGSQMGTSAGIFGATQTLSPFSSNTTSSASSSPTFNSLMPMPAFGVSYAPAFSGLSVSCQKPAFGGIRSTPTQTIPFGSTIQLPQPAFGSNSQQSQPASGSSIFDSSTSTRAFGETTVPTFVSTGNAFGMSSAPVFGGERAFVASSSPVFGSSSTSAFGASSSPAFCFGSSTQACGQSSSAFGTSNPVGSTNSTFGGQSSAFGSHTPTQTFENTGIGQSEFGRQRGGSRVSSYSAPTEPDGGSGKLGKFESISTMLVYKDRSHEELRWEDYQLGDKGGPLASAPQSTGIAGFKSYATQTNAFSPSLVVAQSSANPFSSTIPNSNNPFAPKTSTFSFGFRTSAPAFSSSAFGSSSTSTFGTSSSLASGASSIPAFGFCSSTEACGQSSSAFGPQNHTQAFVNTGIGQPRFVGHRRGSKVASYSATTEENSATFGHIGNLNSISAMPFYKDKSHEELRWEDYQLGTKAFGQSSSRPFGSSQSVSGQQNNSSNNPSASKPFGSPTPLGLQTANSSTSAGVFGATQTLSPFSSNTTSSASSSPAFNSSMPASGASSTSAFGNSSAPFGGLSVFGQKPAFGGFSSSPTQTNPFGSAIQPPQPASGSNTQQSQPAFGRSIFDSSTRFCASSQPVFGSTSSPAFRATNTPAYGATTPAFSFGSSTQVFGQSSSAFGTSSPFRSTTSAFGGSQTPTQAFGNTGIGQSGFGGQRGGSRVASYSATTETDDGSALPRSLESISAMPVYKGKSHEELRWEDCQLGDKGGPLASPPQSTGMAGFNSSTTQTNAFSPSPAPAFGQSSANPFSSTTPNSNNPFAPKTSTFSSGFGTSAPAFSSPAFGSSTSAAAPSIFASPQSPFGANSSSQPFGSSPSLFGNNTSSQPFVSSTTSPFGSSMFGNTQSSPLFDSSAPTNPQSGSTFGQNTSPFGQTGAFSQPSLFNPPSSGLVGSIFSNSASVTSNAPTGFDQTAPSLSMPFQTAQPAQSSGTFSFSNFGQTQPGSQTPTQTLENTDIGQSEFGRQRGGSRVASYSATTELDGGFGQLVKFESISTMSIYKDKSHEELRWEDYQLGDKGGPLASAPRSTGMAGFNSSTTQTNNSTSIPGSSFVSSTKAWSPTQAFVDKDIRSGQTEKLESISAVLVYKDKSHEELRWEDYQLGSSAATNAQSGSEFSQNTSPLQTAGFRPSSFFSSLSSRLVGSITSTRASLTSNALDWVVSYQDRGSMVSLGILTGTVLATVVVSGWISHRCRRA